jgi:uncharacterized HAD superfamily protein
MNAVLEQIIKDIVQNKKSFGMDADDVILDFEPYFRENLNESFGTNLQEGDIVIYDVSKLLPFKEKGVTQKDVYDAVRKMGNKPEFKRLLAREGVTECIKLLLGGQFFSDGYDNFFINTSRNHELYDNIENNTYETMHFNGLMYDDNIVFDPEKEHIARALGLTLSFEDSPTTALRIIKKRVPIIMPARSWNIKTHRDKILLDKKDAEYKHNLIDELESYSGTLFFRINDFVEFRDYLKTIIK